MPHAGVDPACLGQINIDTKRKVFMSKIKEIEIAPAFIMASLLSSYPDEDVVANVSIILEDAEMSLRGNPTLRQSFEPLVKNVKHVFNDRIALEDLRSEYIDIFDRGRHVTSLYETEYGRERAMVKGPQLVDIAGFYRSFGFEMGGDGVAAEMLDHVSVELSFYALLCLKYNALEELKDQEGMEIVIDGRKKFLQAHLGRFIGAIGDRPGVQESPYFSSVFQFCKVLVMNECERLEVEVEPEGWLSPPVVVDEISCGGSVGITPC